MVGTAIASLVAAAVTTAVGGITTYYGKKAEGNALKSQAKAAEAEAAAQAREQERQARLEDERAGIAQIGGEQEAEKRSRILAQDIGSMYADFAGNGLTLDGSAKDSVGAALKTQVGEAQSDISTIRDNAAMTVWTHQANAASYRASAANALIAGQNRANLLKAQAKQARHVGKLGLWQTATGLPLVSSGGWSQMGATVGGMGNLRSSPASAQTSASPNFAGTQGSGGVSPRYANYA